MYDKFRELRKKYTNDKVIWGFRDEYAFLSNFHEVPGGVLGYRTVEHAYVAEKNLDPEFREKVKNCATPGEAKGLGRRVKLREDWEAVRVPAMRRFLKEKFSPGSELARKLLGTGEKMLIEGNVWHDNIWGKCGCDKCRDLPGLNLLGKLLMERRKVLIDLGEYFPELVHGPVAQQGEALSSNGSQ